MQSRAILGVQFSVVHRRLPKAAGSYANRVRSFATTRGDAGYRRRRRRTGDGDRRACTARTPGYSASRNLYPYGNAPPASSRAA
jgi:hypothetical protein